MNLSLGTKLPQHHYGSQWEEVKIVYDAEKE
jgi:hypothetical protein